MGQKKKKKKGARPARRTGGAALGRKAKAGIAALLVGTLAAVTSFLIWLSSPAEGKGAPIELILGDDSSSVVADLEAAHAVTRPLSFRLLLLVTRPFAAPVPGAHLLADNLTPAEVLRRITRLSSRAHVRVLVPEGYNRFQIAARLESSGVCSRAAFGDAASDAPALAGLGIGAASAEGYLFPATYDLFADASAASVVAEMVRGTARLLSGLEQSHGADFERLKERYGFAERDVLTLASIVEKEAARAEERPVIASVFYNRLDSADFRPARSLQSDPTAVYGCLLLPALASCRDYSGRVTPGMLRGDDNPYNTYRHPGLPPSPISNPGADSILAVLSPAITDYFFFVATGDGRHTFSHSLEEHDAAIRKPR